MPTNNIATPINFKMRAIIVKGAYSRVVKGISPTECAYSAA